MNQLASEKSPYLLQHADNPVDWYPWTAAVFARARDENRLVFLSIGYSTCHWCHVMAHECFEDEEVAALLNRDYLAVKVDREERPDIDQVYMEACQRLTRGGGWPLTIIMTPEGEPFYAATYVPKHGRHGRPGLMELLPWVSEKWRSDPQPLRHAAQELVQMMRTGRDSGDRTEVDLVLQDQAALLLKRSYDQEHGGFGQAPKFPRPHDLTFLLMRHDMTGDAEALSMVEKTLRAMRSGGIYDQVGWGFHRYATDAHWLVPHFEKMLYDQAGLVQAYLDAWQTTGRADYAETVREILAYLARDMTSPEGAFYSAEDADSEGVEGKFYLWTEAEIRALLGDEAEAFCRAYNVRSAGNYHDEVSGRLTGSNILHLGAAADEPAGLAPAGRFPASCERLLAARGQRIRPHLDDKIITAWNGMAISAFAAAGRALGDEALLARARRAADYLLATLRTGEGRLLRSCRLGEPSVGAFAEDYAFTARGLLDLYAADFAPRLLQQAVEFAAVLRNFFQDPASGRLYDAPSDGERLLVRPSSSYDGATPSAAAATLDVFARLFLLTGDASWRNAADLLLGAVSADLARYPAGYTALLQAANWLLRPSREVVIVGRRGDPAAEAMLAVACSCRPRQTVVLFKAQDQADAIEPLAPFTRQMSAASGSASAYLCENFSCSTPTDDPARLRALLEQPL